MVDNPDLKHTAELVQQAYQMLAAGQVQQAEAVCQQLMQHHPTPDVLHLQGVLQLQAQRLRPAMQSVQRAIKADPDKPVFYITLGRIQHGLGRLDTAEKSLLQAIKLRPDLVAAHFQLGVWCAEQHRYDQAEKHYRTLLSYAAADAQTCNNLATVLHEMERYDEAVDFYRRAIMCQPDYFMAIYNLANVLKSMGDYNAAIEAYQQVLQLRPDAVEAYIQLGEMLRFQGQLDEAIALYRQAIKGRHDFTEAYRLLSQLKRFREYDADVVSMEALQSESLNESQQMHLQFALGKAYEDLHQYDAAFSSLQKANQLYRSHIDGYDVQDDVRLMRQLMSVFDANFFAERSSWSGSDAAPVFVLGMPRSGTTLVESILARHPNVYGAGEINALYEALFCKEGLCSADRYPARVAQIRQQDLQHIAVDYLTRVAAVNVDGRAVVVNKMPVNFIYLGMIRLLFPGARIINCVRDPIDTCFSCYKNYFVGAQPFAYDLHDLACYYATYQRLMQHWRTVLPGFIHDLHYEALVTDQRGQSRQLLDFCGLPWDEACLDFHRGERNVKTASSAQVRQPMYQSSTGIWQHYGEQLRPLIKCLRQQGVLSDQVNEDAGDQDGI
jgi:tetratricopeptide (TPR) repeat protein